MAITPLNPLNPSGLPSPDYIWFVEWGDASSFAGYQEGVRGGLTPNDYSLVGINGSGSWVVRVRTGTHGNIPANATLELTVKSDNPPNSSKITLQRHDNQDFRGNDVDDFRGWIEQNSGANVDVEIIARDGNGALWGPSESFYVLPAIYPLIGENRILGSGENVFLLFSFTVGTNSVFWRGVRTPDDPSGGTSFGQFDSSRVIPDTGHLLTRINANTDNGTILITTDQSSRIFNADSISIRFPDFGDDAFTLSWSNSNGRYSVTAVGLDLANWMENNIGLQTTMEIVGLG